jgi:hypothetical protein
LEKRTLIRQADTLKGLRKYLNGLDQLGDTEEIEKVEVLINQVEQLEKPKPKATTDKRKIDEILFWGLIDNARKSSNDKSEFIEILSTRLEEFKPTEIRRFERIFRTKFQELNHWNQWALAYIVRRGCGDDEFDYYKAWVISKGLDAFNNIKELKKDSLKHLFNEDPQLEDFLYLTERVYENKTGELMSPVRVKKQKISGTAWDEENIDAEFPELSKIFEFKK